jgi:hypothetical protein
MNVASVGVALPYEITYSLVDQAYQKALTAQKQRNQGFADRGMRAARARDAKVMLCLEKATEVLAAEEERQRGRTRRAGIEESEKVHVTELNLFREAYSCADRGTPLVNFEWIYGAATWMAGYRY